jgi:hypothetical protein
MLSADHKAKVASTGAAILAASSHGFAHGKSARD